MAVTVTAAQLRRIVGGSPPYAQATAEAFNAYAHIWGINDSALRASHFLAQICHESKLRYVREIWGNTAAQRRYEGRRDLGNTVKGDGKRFMGHGLLQVTGRANHRAFTQWIRKAIPSAPDFEANPDALAAFPWAFISACWFWDTRRLNALADEDDVLAITKKVNGGTNGLADRRLMLARAKEVLKADEEHFASLLGRRSPARGLMAPVDADAVEDAEVIDAVPHWPEDDLKPYEIMALQVRLRELGYSTVGAPNGDFGGATRGALIAFQTDHGIEPTGHYDAETREALSNDANKRPIADERANVTAADLLERGSRTVAATTKIKETSAVTTIVTAGGTAAGAVVQYGSDAATWIGSIKDSFEKIPWWVWPAIFLGIVWYMASQANKAEAARVDDERKFKNTADPSPKLVSRILGHEDHA